MATAILLAISAPGQAFLALYGTAVAGMLFIWTVVLLTHLRFRASMSPAELARLPNVIATPHIGGLTPPAIESQSLETVRQVAKIIAGEAPVGAVNADRWTRRP